jgi:hypothetical protein
MTEEITAPAAKTPRRPFARRKPAPAAADVQAAANRASAMPRASMLSRMKARPNWESDDFVGVGMDGVDRLKIPKDIVDALWRDGIALQWITRSVRGQETPQEMSRMTRGGWTPIHQSDFDGILDGMFMPKGADTQITVDDCMLVARPTEIQKKATRQQAREAAMPLQIAEEQLGHGIPGVTGSNHKSVQNSIKRTFERVEIPE